MLPVEIVYSHGSIVLRARSSELLILPDHVRELKERKEPGPFSEYFINHALVNRPARKLFEAWLRKDRGVWMRLFKVVQNASLDESEDTMSQKGKEQEESIAKVSQGPKSETENQPLKKKDVKQQKTEKETPKKEEAKKEEMRKEVTKKAKPSQDKTKKVEKPATKKIQKKTEKTPVKKTKTTKKASTASSSKKSSPSKTREKV